MLPSLTTDVRAFGAYESGGTWAVYAGVSPTGILRGTWSRADCAGALYVSINTKLFRRNDGPLPPGATRWVLVYRAPPVGPFNSGLRGLTCISHDGSPSLLISTEGTGDVYRFDHLPRGQLARPRRLTPRLELSAAQAISRMLAAVGTAVPARSIGYVIAAYNNFLTIDVSGSPRQLFGFEWNYRGMCPGARACTPGRWDAAACFAVRTEQHRSPSYALRCLSGPSFVPARTIGSPVRSGQAFVAIRTIAASPFGDRRLYYGGFDCDFFPADGTAWIAQSALSALHLGGTR